MSLSQAFAKLKTNIPMAEKEKICLEISSNSLISDKSTLIDYIIHTLYKHPSQVLLNLLASLLDHYPRNIMSLLHKTTPTIELYKKSLKTMDQSLEFLLFLLKNNNYHELISYIINSIEFVYSKKVFIQCLELLNLISEKNGLHFNLLFVKIISNVIFCPSNVIEFTHIFANSTCKSYQKKFIDSFTFTKHAQLLDIYFQKIVLHQLDLQAGLNFFKILAYELDYLDETLTIVKKYCFTGVDMSDVYSHLMKNWKENESKKAFKCLQILLTLDFNSAYSDIENLIKIMMNVF